VCLPGGTCGATANAPTSQSGGGCDASARCPTDRAQLVGSLVALLALVCVRRRKGGG
jgi:hypothetical protein